MKLIELFPYDDFESAIITEFNRDLTMEYERVRDFLILHYHATTRNDSEFWNYCRTLKIPESLLRKMQLFREQGHVERYLRGMFLEPSWVAVYLGQGIKPERYHPLVDQLNHGQLQHFLGGIRNALVEQINSMPTHSETIARYCRLDSANSKEWPPAAMSLYGVFS